MRDRHIWEACLADAGFANVIVVYGYTIKNLHAGRSLRNRCNWLVHLDDARYVLPKVAREIARCRASGMQASGVI